MSGLRHWRIFWMLPTDKLEVPKCGVVIQKEGQASLPCPNDAEYLINVVDPDDPDRTRIISVLLLCKRHADKFDEGKTLILQDEEGNLEMVASGTQPPPDGNIEGHSAAS
jgi:hypothetical protein